MKKSIKWNKLKILGIISIIVVIVLLILVFGHGDIVATPDHSELGLYGLTAHPQVISGESLEKYQSYFKTGQRVDYESTQNDLIPSVQNIIREKMGMNLQVNTFRCSNGLHIVGASGFHRDQFDYTDTQYTFPSYTILIYLDNARFEYIPGSHLYKRMSIFTAIQQLRYSKKICIPPGTVIVMNGSVVHRALPSQNTNRRLIQCFVTLPDNYPTDNVILKWNDLKSQSQWMTKFLPIFNIFYSIQQMCRLQIPFTRNYIPQSIRQGKLVSAYSMPVRKKNEDDENLYVMMPNNRIVYYK